jgi:hypothetical protein
MLLGMIRCECGGEMEVDESETVASTEGVCYTVECLQCRAVGGYNGATLEVFGATDGLEIVGE